MTSPASGFLKRAEAEARRYGSDPWVFFRELGQNSRDAFASRIDVAVEQTTPLRQPGGFGGQALLELEFSDDGLGMTFEHARRYFFRLYSSSKDRDDQAAGKYGVGFWSVLLFKPRGIEVHSRNGSESWGMYLSGDLEEVRRIDCRRDKPGTTIVLQREIPSFASRLRQGYGSQAASECRGEGLPELLKGLEAGLVRYLSFLRTAHRRARPLPVKFNGQPIGLPFRLKGAGSLAFQDGPVEGVVGFGDRPHYELYARGLPVVSGNYLEELEGRKIRRRSRSDHQGTSPVYLLNGNQLDVVLSRQTVLKNKSLARLVDTARKRFDQLVSRTVGRTVERAWHLRLWDWLESFLVRSGQVPAWVRWSLFILTLFTLGGILGLIATRIPMQESPDPGPGELAVRPVTVKTGPLPTAVLRAPAMRPDEITDDWESSVDQPGPEPDWSLIYAPPVMLYFRLVPLNRYDFKKGWQPHGLDQGWTNATAAEGRGKGVEITLGISDEAGQLLLPLPSGYVPVRGSARLGEQRLRFETNRAGQMRVTLPESKEFRVSYRVVPGGRPEWPPREFDRVALPDEIEVELSRIRGLPPGRRAKAVVELVGTLLAYDRSAATSRKFNSGREQDWITRLVTTGAGDCDLINGFLAVLLNKVGIPARLVIGIVGKEGRAVRGTHAWVEADVGGLKVLDATSGLAPRHSQVEPAVGSEPVAAPVRQNESAALLPWILLVSSLGVLLVLVVWVLRRMPRPGKLSLDADSRQRRKILAGMALEAIRRPSAWVEIPGLWHRPFIPCLGGRGAVLSLARMLRLASRDQLFIGSRSNPLSKDALRSGAWVLDQDDREFAPLFERLTNLRDLEELLSFRPVELPAGPEVFLLAAVNQVLRGKGVRIELRATKASDQRVLVDVDLAPIRPSRAGFPARFVAVNTRDEWWQEMARLHGESPELAVCLVVDRLGRDSVLLRPHAPALRRRAARLLLAGAGTSFAKASEVR